MQTLCWFAFFCWLFYIFRQPYFVATLAKGTERDTKGYIYGFYNQIGWALIIIPVSILGDQNKLDNISFLVLLRTY